MTTLMETSSSNIDIHNIFENKTVESKYTLYDAIIDICKIGNVNILKAIHTSEACQKILSNNDIVIWDEKTCEVAAYNRNIDILKYLHENGCPWNSKTCIETVRYNNNNLDSNNANFKLSLDCLTYAYENGCPLVESIIYTCISSGFLDCLKYILEQEDCCWSTETYIVVNNELLENESIT